MPRGVSIALIVLACALIAVGRMRVRRAWRLTADGQTARARFQKTTGWMLVAIGALAMIAGIVAW